MRYFLALAFCFLLGHSHAHACLGDDRDLFFKMIPSPESEADLIAIISISKIEDGPPKVTVTGSATVIRIIESSDTRVKAGDEISLQVLNLSCGPHLWVGGQGMIIAKVGTNRKGAPVLHPYSHKSFRGDERIEAPVILPDGFELFPHPLQINDEIPQGFAVVLVGFAGKTLIDSIVLGHSQKRYRMHARFPEQSNSILAFAIPLGIKQLSVTAIGKARNELTREKFDIDRPGVYYMATLDTDTPGKFDETPLPDQLKQFGIDYANTIGHLEAINFKWPHP